MKRRAEKPGPYLRFCVLILYPLMNLLWRRRWVGLHRIPQHGPAILAINHISYADPLVIGRVLWDARRSPHFLAKAGLFTVPIVGRIVRGARQIPVYRGTVDASDALRGAVEALDRGEIVLIYPEGTVTRDPDFWPMQAKSGTARLSLMRPDVPVIPVGQWGAQLFLDYYAKRFRPLPRKTMTVAIGEPIDLSRFHGRPARPGTLHEMTDVIMRAVADQVSAIRGEPAPVTLFRRPGSEASTGGTAPTQGHDLIDRGESA